ncbi:hypothetical protein C8Q77DRAFT_541306 [Trametes polyzona]|nr:hypothetical protein C8Q77DRAFT_541306 [Trametes polyzona]
MTPGSNDKEQRIPLPRGFRSCSFAPLATRNALAVYMRLGDSPGALRTYCQIVATVASLSEEHANHIPVIPIRTDRCREEWLKFVELFLIPLHWQVKTELPILNRYVDAWPAAVIVREHRHRRRVTLGGLTTWSEHRMLAAANTTSLRNQSVDDDHHQAISLRGKENTTAAGAARRPPSLPSPRHSSCPRARPRGRDGQRHTPAPAASRAPRIAENSGNPPASRADSSSEPTHDEPRKELQEARLLEPCRREHAQVVLEFLRSLLPDQSALLPVLVEKGVVDGVQLDGLARMPAPRRKKLLNAWLREESINELQFDALDAGLEARGRV